MQAARRVVVDLTAPTAATDPFDPAPRIGLVGTPIVSLSELIDPATFGIDDLALAYNGSALALAGVSLAPADDAGTAFRVDGLDGRPGTYTLTVLAGVIADRAGNAGAGRSVSRFVVQPRGAMEGDYDGDGVSDPALDRHDAAGGRGGVPQPGGIGAGRRPA